MFSLSSCTFAFPVLQGQTASGFEMRSSKRKKDEANPQKGLLRLILIMVQGVSLRAFILENSKTTKTDSRRKGAINR